MEGSRYGLCLQEEENEQKSGFWATLSRRGPGQKAQLQGQASVF